MPRADTRPLAAMGKEQARANAAVEKALSSFSVKELEEIQTSDLPVKGGAMRLQVSCPNHHRCAATSLLTLPSDRPSPVLQGRAGGGPL